MLQKPLTNPRSCDTMITLKPKPKHTYIFKARWQGTAILLKVEAKDEDEGMVKAEKMVHRMEGRTLCSEIIFIRQVK